nr:ribbon-helix-helix protein, CopG family [uncultured Agathobaculum sp.]
MGNFIPKPYRTEQVSIRLDTELLAQVEAAANKYDMSRNAFINECIRYALSNMADSPENETN